MVTGILEAMATYQLIQPMVSLQIKLIQDIITAIRAIRKLANDYKNRFDSLKDLADRVSRQYVYFKKLIEALEQLSQSNTKSLTNEVKNEINKELASFVAELDGTLRKLQSYQDRILTTATAKDASVMANTVAAAKRALGSLDYISEGKVMLENAILVSDKCCNQLMIRLTFFLSLDNNKKLAGLFEIGDSIHESFKAINISKMTMDLPITRFLRRIVKAREKAEKIRNLTLSEMERRVVPETDLPMELMVTLEHDTDLTYGKRLERMSEDAPRFPCNLIDPREIQGGQNLERDMRQALFLAALLSDDTDYAKVNGERGEDNAEDKNENEKKKDGKAEADSGSGSEEDLGFNRLFNVYGGLPKCVGVIYRWNLRRFELMFEIPLETKRDSIMSLRKVLNDPACAKHALDDRYRLALRMAESVYLVHTAGLIHKFIRPESFLLMERDGSDKSMMYPNRLGDPYLFGFAQVREDGAFTDRKHWKEYPKRVLLYRPPRHQDKHLQGQRLDRYRLMDDIYSLGVCLLELGLWRSFFKWEGNSWGEGTYVPDADAFDFRQRLAAEVLDDLIDLAERELPGKMGRAYTGVVLQILGCFKSDNSGKFTRFPDYMAQPAEVMGAFEKIVLKSLRALVYNFGSAA